MTLLFWSSKKYMMKWDAKLLYLKSILFLYHVIIQHICTTCYREIPTVYKGPSPYKRRPVVFRVVFLGRLLVVFWTSFGRLLVVFWSSFGRLLVAFKTLVVIWSSFALVVLWSSFGRLLDFGRLLVDFWPSFGRLFSQFWSPWSSFCKGRGLFN